MPATLISDPGAINANSFISREEGNAFSLEVLNATAWTGVGVTNDQRDTALIQYSRLLSAWLERNLIESSARSFADQSLATPRTGLTRGGESVDTLTNPFEVRYATFIGALSLLGGETGKPKLQTVEGISELKADVVTIKFRDLSSLYQGGISDDIIALFPREWLRDVDVRVLKPVLRAL